MSRIFERGVQYLLVPPKKGHQILKGGGSNLELKFGRERPITRALTDFAC